MLTHPKTTHSKRKQIIVAIGRQFSVDWWRVRTRRCQAADLGLQTNPTPPTVAPTPRARKTKAAQNANRPSPNPKLRMNTQTEQGNKTMSFSLWTLACGVILQTKRPAPNVVGAGLDASAIQGRPGARVALLQSPIPRAAPRA